MQTPLYLNCFSGIVARDDRTPRQESLVRSHHLSRHDFGKVSGYTANSLARCDSGNSLRDLLFLLSAFGLGFFWELRRVEKRQLPAGQIEFH